MHRMCIALLGALQVAAASSFDLKLQTVDNQLLLTWPGSLSSTSGATVYPVFQVEQSADLRNWLVLSSDLKLSGSGPGLDLLVPRNEPHAFFRVVAQLPQTQAYTLAAGGAEVFGYTKAFDRELERLGLLSLPDFSTAYPAPNNYLARINWDPTTAQYWNLFDTDPAINNIGLQPTNHGYRYYDFRMSPTELAILRQHGFVATKRLAQPHFSEAFYRLWNDDLPVFISTDALLHAWHRSYENMLMELEVFWFTTVIREILDAMAQQITAAHAEAAPGVFEESLLDADYFITVARSLLANSQQQPSSLGQDPRVQATLAAIAGEQYQCFSPFGQERYVDFSQFKPRGHYEHYLLQAYFKTMMWLGRMDLRVGGRDTDCNGFVYQVSPRQLGTAIVLTRLLELSGKFPKWQSMDRMLETFVGWSDSLNFTQFSDLLHSSGINTLADIATTEKLADFQHRIEQGELGVQNVRGDAFGAKLGHSNLSLPRCFAFMGQRFVLDSWAISKVVSPAIRWVDTVNRRVASGLDVAFAVLQNDQVVPDILERITNSSARTSTNHTIRWRDGYLYQHNLAAARNIVDQQSPEAWESNIYISWLAALRALSMSTTGANFPEPLRTHAWAMKTLNTQMASWTELRHDTLLYAKPTYTDPGLCSFPDGYVEPRVEFWRLLEAMLRRTASLIEAAPYQGTVSNLYTGEVRLGDLQTAQLNFLSFFADQVRALGDIAEHELRQGRLTAAQIAFIDGMMQNNGMGYSQTRLFNGWYPKLYYKSRVHRDSMGTWDREYGSQKYDPLIVDVHNDVPKPDIWEDGQWVSDPGGILHEAVGRVDLLYLVVNVGAERLMYAGPVMSHYEFETPFPVRKSDSEWEDDIVKSRTPAPPPWTASYLVP
jgi:hypothetical protein